MLWRSQKVNTFIGLYCYRRLSQQEQQKNLHPAHSALSCHIFSFWGSTFLLFCLWDSKASEFHTTKSKRRAVRLRMHLNTRLLRGKQFQQGKKWCCSIPGLHASFDAQQRDHTDFRKWTDIEVCMHPVFLQEFHCSFPEIFRTIFFHSVINFFNETCELFPSKCTRWPLHTRMKCTCH